jgi:hypothetical protein
MRINHLAVAVLIFALSMAGQAQSPDGQKVNALAAAISHAEGFGVRGAIPSRYHNPGDLKANRSSDPWPGQVRIGTAGHIVFRDDESGKAALRDCIIKMVDGRSVYFNPNMTLNQVARRYAQNWSPWVKIVSKDLGVPPTTTLRAYFETKEKDDSPPALGFRPLPTANPVPTPPVVTVAQPHVLDAVLDIPVDVPPLVEEDAPQHHKVPLLRQARYQKDWR